MTEPLDAEEVDAICSGLADRTRSGIVERLSEGPLTSSDLADALGVSYPSMSRHLKVLRDRGLVREQNDPADARLRVYQLDVVKLEALAQWLERVTKSGSARGRSSLSAPARPLAPRAPAGLRQKGRGRRRG
jgi:DNA-binding transcriptional ArsR family regulator